ncbi:hypothetical protein P4S63_18505 [Pseudoalteromonas sp. B193]
MVFQHRWYFSFAWNSNLISETEDAIATYQELDTASFDRNNLLVLNDRLKALRNLPASNLNLLIHKSLNQLGLIN